MASSTQIIVQMVMEHGEQPAMSQSPGNCAACTKCSASGVTRLPKIADDDITAQHNPDIQEFYNFLNTVDA